MSLVTAGVCHMRSDDTAGHDLDPKLRVGGTTDRVIVLWRGHQCDITHFVHKHPGGAKLLRAVNGLEIEKYMNGEESVNEYSRKHSASAYRILKQLAIDPLLDDSLISDAVRRIRYDKPIMSQVGNLGEFYWKWIHQPVDIDLRMFYSNFWESLSRTPWYVIPILWMPFVVGFGVFAYHSMFSSGRSHLECVVLFMVTFALGMLVWSLMEYLLHRYAFHWRPPHKCPRLIWLHFLLHGLHHKTPLDKGRLVFPPVLAFPIVFTILGVYLYVVPRPYVYSMSAGNLFGYVVYDLIHFYMHHGLPPPNSMLLAMKKYHHAHHFTNPNTGFGISSRLWDIPFGTAA